LGSFPSGPLFLQCDHLGHARAAEEHRVIVTVAVRPAAASTEAQRPRQNLFHGELSLSQKNVIGSGAIFLRAINIFR
jgi:hypothetical protein